MHNFKELNIWTKSIDLSVETYELTKRFPESEKFGLISRLKRCAVSIPSNIAEGSSRSSNKDFARFLQIALDSAFEPETQLIISEKVFTIEKVKTYELKQQVIEIQKMINGFKKSIQSKI